MPTPPGNPREEIELALKDSVSAALKQVGANLEAVRKKALQFSEDSTKSLGQTLVEAEKAKTEVGIATRALGALHGTVTSIGRNLAGPFGVLASFVAVGKALDQFNSNALRLRATSINTRLTAENLGMLRQTVERGGLSFADAQAFTEHVATAVESMRFGANSPVYMALVHTNRKALADAMKAQVSAGDNLGATRTFYEAFENDSKAGKIALSQAIGLDKATLGKQARNIKKYIAERQVDIADAARMHSRWLDATIRLNNAWVEAGEEIGKAFDNPKGILEQMAVLAARFKLKRKTDRSLTSFLPDLTGTPSRRHITGPEAGFAGPGAPPPFQMGVHSREHALFDEKELQDMRDYFRPPGGGPFNYQSPYGYGGAAPGLSYVPPKRAAHALFDEQEVGAMQNYMRPTAPPAGGSNQIGLGGGFGDLSQKSWFRKLMGFEEGGVVPGPPGRATTIVAHGGEIIIPRSMVERFGPGIQLATYTVDDKIDTAEENRQVLLDISETLKRMDEKGSGLGGGGGGGGAGPGAGPGSEAAGRGGRGGGDGGGDGRPGSPASTALKTPAKPEEGPSSVKEAVKAGSVRQVAGGGDAGTSATSREAYAVEFFKKKGWSEEAALGFVASLHGETANLNIRETHDQGRGYGIAGWDRTRQADFKNKFGHDMRQSTLDEQLEFYHKEASGEGDPGMARAGRVARQKDATAAQVAHDVTYYGERPGAKAMRANQRAGWVPGMRARIKSFSDEHPATGGAKVGAMVPFTTADIRTALQGADAAPAAAAPGATTPTRAEGAPGTSELQRGHGRSGELNKTLRNQLDAVSNATGVGFEVFSGGEVPGGFQSGSGRHQHGGAADTTMYVIAGGKKHYLDANNPADLPKIQQVIAESKRQGIVGIGIGPGYMGGHEGTAAHLGGGKPMLWGARGASKNAPAYARVAYEHPEKFPAIREHMDAEQKQPQAAKNIINLSVRHQPGFAKVTHEHTADSFSVTKDKAPPERAEVNTPSGI